MSHIFFIIENIQIPITKLYKTFTLSLDIFYNTDIIHILKLKFHVREINYGNNFSCSVEVLWFSPAMNPFEHSLYGNVRFTINFEDILERFGAKFYYIDLLVFPGQRFSRILLTRRDLSMYFKPVDLTQPSCPLQRGLFGYQPVISCGRKGIQHFLNLAIEVTADDCCWFFDRSMVTGCNHGLANSRSRWGTILRKGPVRCQKYNLFGMYCQNKLTKEKADGKLCRDENLFFLVHKLDHRNTLHPTTPAFPHNFQLSTPRHNLRMQPTIIQPLTYTPQYNHRNYHLFAEIGRDSYY